MVSGFEQPSLSLEGNRVMPFTWEESQLLALAANYAEMRN